MNRNTRRISWIKAARKAFERFPIDAQIEIQRALTVAAEGRKADIAKPMKGLGSGIKTPQPDIDVIRERIKRLKELMK